MTTDKQPAPQPAPPPTPSPFVSDEFEKKTGFLDKVIEWAYKIISIALIPLVIWIFNVERRMAATNTELAVQKQRNAQYQEKLAELTRISKEISDLVDKNNKALIRFNGEFRVVNVNIEQLKKDLKKIDKLGDQLNALLRK